MAVGVSRLIFLLTPFMHGYRRKALLSLAHDYTRGFPLCGSPGHDSAWRPTRATRRHDRCAARAHRSLINVTLIGIYNRIFHIVIAIEVTYNHTNTKGESLIQRVSKTQVRSLVCQSLASLGADLVSTLCSVRCWQDGRDYGRLAHAATSSHTSQTAIARHLPLMLLHSL